MAIKPLLSFASGELDPVLTDNVTLEKFNKGLATARNVFIGKTGSILSRASRRFCRNGKNNNEAIRIYHPTNSTALLEFGNLYVRIYSIDFDYSLSYTDELVTTITEADLPNLHFTTSKDYVYIFCVGQKVQKLFLDPFFSSPAFVPDADVYKILPAPGAVSVSPVGSPTGYLVDYLMTLVVNNEETEFSENITGYAKPIAAGQSNAVTTGWVTADFGNVTEARVYSRPSGGGAYGYLGATTSFTVVGANTSATFIDIGSLPDYENGTQDLITNYGLEAEAMIDLEPKTGIIYQQRLIQTTAQDEEAILASRPGFQNNFYRDFPYAPDSALQFKAGTSGRAKVLRFLDSDGLIAFTTNGVYINSGLLSVNNLGMDRKGAWIIDETLPPLVVPGGVFFVDQNNTIRQLIFNQQLLGYESVEQTIFSNHLFQERTIKTWAFQNGVAPLIIVTFSDGTFATFTYNYEHEMKAWTRHDSKYPVEQVEGTTIPDVSYFVTNKDGQRSIELNLARKIPVRVLVASPESDRSENHAFMDALKTQSYCINDRQLNLDEYFIVAPVSAGVWDGNLTVTTDVGLDLTGLMDVGDILRVFNPVDETEIDLEVLSFTGLDTITVTPSDEFPEALAESARVYLTFNVISDLDHLEGEEVSVMVDGYLVASPLNDVEEYPVLTVSGGEITLPDDLKGAIIHVGRPIVADVKTLNISTVEQSPTLIESVNVNKIYIRVNKSRGLYCSNKFPEEANDEVDGSSVEGMESLDESLVPPDGIITGNRYLPPVSRRLEKTIPGAWDSQGRISIRQVDPFHFELISLIPDVEVQKRSDR